MTDEMNTEAAGEVGMQGYRPLTTEEIEAKMHLTDETLAEIDKALTDADELISTEMPSYRRDVTKSIQTYLIDHDFDATVRNLLITFEDANFDIRTFLTEETKYRQFDGDPQPRYLDLIRVWRMLRYLADPEHYTRDELSGLYMRYSLCPLHHLDWAICFDDQDPECSQIRAIFPHGHDT